MLCIYNKNGAATRNNQYSFIKQLRWSPSRNTRSHTRTQSISVKYLGVFLENETWLDQNVLITNTFIYGSHLGAEGTNLGDQEITELSECCDLGYESDSDTQVAELGLLLMDQLAIYMDEPTTYELLCRKEFNQERFKTGWSGNTRLIKCLRYIHDTENGNS